MYWTRDSCRTVELQSTVFNPSVSILISLIASPSSASFPLHSYARGTEVSHREPAFRLDFLHARHAVDTLFGPALNRNCEVPVPLEELPELVDSPGARGRYCSGLLMP